MKLRYCIIIFLMSNTMLCQEKLGSWNILSLNLKMNTKWNFFVESQVRSLSFYNQFHYYEIKTGGTYKMSNNFSFTSGFGSYNTYQEGENFKTPMLNKEVRTWIQFNLKNQYFFSTIDHRYRAEQRFTSNGYRNRFRYRLGVSVPVNNLKIEPKTLYLSIWDEIFLTDKEPFFERNRLFLGSGYEFSTNLAIQAGYIYQFDYKINDETGRDFFSIALLYNIDLTKKEKQDFVPTTAD